MFNAVQWFDKEYNEEINKVQLSVEANNERKFTKLLNKLNVDYTKENVVAKDMEDVEIFIFDLNELFNAMIIKVGV